MIKHELARQLRGRQHAYGLVEPATIDALSDDEIVDSYVTCSDCGAKQVEGRRLDAAIAGATDADDFFRICNRLAKQHSHH